MNIGNFNLFFGKAKGLQHIEGEIIQLLIREAKHILAEFITKAVSVKGKFHIKGVFQTSSQLGQHRFGKAFFFQRADRDGLTLLKAAMTDGIAGDILNLCRAVTKAC